MQHYFFAFGFKYSIISYSDRATCTLLQSDVFYPAISFSPPYQNNIMSSEHVFQFPPSLSLYLSPSSLFVKPQISASSQITLFCWCIHSVSKLIHVNPLPSLLINKFSPLTILRNQPFIQLRIIGNPSLLTNNIGNSFTL